MTEAVKRPTSKHILKAEYHLGAIEADLVRIERAMRGEVLGQDVANCHKMLADANHFMRGAASAIHQLAGHARARGMFSQ